MTKKTIEDVRFVDDMKESEVIWPAPGILYGVRYDDKQVVKDGGIACIVRRHDCIYAEAENGDLYRIAQKTDNGKLADYVLTSRLVLKRLGLAVRSKDNDEQSAYGFAIEARLKEPVATVLQGYQRNRGLAMKRLTVKRLTVLLLVLIAVAAVIWVPMVLEFCSTKRAVQPVIDAWQALR